MFHDNWSGIVNCFKGIQGMIESWGPDSGGHYVVGNPVVRRLEMQMSTIFAGQFALTTRGMTAIQATIEALTCASDTIVCSTAIYIGTRLWLEDLEADGRINIIWWDDPTDIDLLYSKTIGMGVKPKLIYTETIGNSKEMPVVNMEALCDFAQKHGITVVCDITFTPFYRPVINLDAGVNDQLVLVGSMTKYHSNDDNVMGGFISAEPEMLQKITGRFDYSTKAMLPMIAKYYLKPAQLALIEKRYRGHCAIALETAEFLKKSPAVSAVYYPAMTDHPGYEFLTKIDKSKHIGGAVLYIELKGGKKAVAKFCNYLHDKQNWEQAVSFGSDVWRFFPFIEEVVHTDKMENLIRISVGYDVSKTERNLNLFLQNALASISL